MKPHPSLVFLPDLCDICAQVFNIRKIILLKKQNKFNMMHQETFSIDKHILERWFVSFILEDLWIWLKNSWVQILSGGPDSLTYFQGNGTLKVFLFSKWLHFRNRHSWKSKNSSSHFYAGQCFIKVLHTLFIHFYWLLAGASLRGTLIEQCHEHLLPTSLARKCYM